MGEVRYNDEPAIDHAGPSKEALARAYDLLGFSPNDPMRQRTPKGCRPHRIAIALQQLMDERDAWLRRHAEGAAQHITVVERAEKAEAKLAELVRWVRQWAGQPATDMMGKLAAKLLEFEAKP